MNESEYANGLYRFYWALRHHFVIDKKIEFLSDKDKIIFIENWLKKTDFSAIEILCLSGQNLIFIPPEIKRFVNLRWLNIAENQLSYLPKEIENLTLLEHLDISNNKFNQIPLLKIKYFYS